MRLCQKKIIKVYMCLCGVRGVVSTSMYICPRANVFLRMSVRVSPCVRLRAVCVISVITFTIYTIDFSD